MRPDLTARPIRNLRTACRVYRQAVAIWSWIKAVCASVAGFPSRLLKSISDFAKGLFAPTAAPAVRPPKKQNGVEPKPSAGPLWQRLRRLVSISGFRRSRPADRTSPIAPKSSSASSNTSAAPADSPPCSSSSITTRRRGAARGTGCSKRSAGSSPRTSIKGASNGRSRSGPKTNSSKSCRPDSNRPCK